MTLVVDASVVLNWFFEDERDDFGVRALEEVRAQHALVPPLWNFEVANALVAAERHGRIDARQVTTIVEDLRALPIIVESVGGRPWVSEIVFARKHGLTAYDAAYLDIAVRHTLTLVTRETKLAAAARDYDLLWAPPAASL